jgi:capsule polysaccharide export protein KpsE/RkpR
MATIPQRIASAFTILFGQHGDVTQLARDRDRSRQALYREAEQVLDVVDGTAARDQVHALEQQVAQLQAQVRDLRVRLERSVEMTPEKQAEVACVAQAEGVSLPVARRLLQVLLPPKTRSVPTLGRATAEAGSRAGRLLEVLDEAAQSHVTQATADEIFSAASRS